MPCVLRTSTGSSETSATVSHVAAEFTASVFVAGNAGVRDQRLPGFSLAQNRHEGDRAQQ